MKRSSDNDELAHHEVSKKKSRLSASQFLDSLANNRGEALREALDVIQINNDVGFIQDLLKQSPDLKELISVINESSTTDDHLRHSDWHLVFDLIHCVSMIAYNDLDEDKSIIVAMLKGFIENDTVQHNLISGLCKSNTSGRIKTRLRIMALASSLCSNLATTCSELFVDNNSKVWKWLLNRRDSKVPEDIRATTIALICSLINSKKLCIIESMLKKNGILCYLFNDLCYDCCSSILTLCESIKRGILTNNAVSKTLKIEFFTTYVMKNLIKTLNWTGLAGWRQQAKGLQDTVSFELDDSNSVQSSLSDLICLILTSNKHGIYFANTNDEFRNFPILNVITSVPLTDDPSIEIVSKVLSLRVDICVRFLESYFTNEQESLRFIVDNAKFVSDILKRISQTINTGNGSYELPKLFQMFKFSFTQLFELCVESNSLKLVDCISILCNLLSLSNHSKATIFTRMKKLRIFDQAFLTLKNFISTPQFAEHSRQFAQAFRSLLISYCSSIDHPNFNRRQNEEDLSCILQVSIANCKLEKDELIYFLENFNPLNFCMQDYAITLRLISFVLAAFHSVDLDERLLSVFVSFLKRFAVFDHNEFELQIWVSVIHQSDNLMCCRHFARIISKCVCNCHPLFDQVFNVVNTKSCKPINMLIDEIQQANIHSLRSQNQLSNDYIKDDFDERVPFSIIIPAFINYIKEKSLKKIPIIDATLAVALSKIVLVQPSTVPILKFLKMHNQLLQEKQCLQTLNLLQCLRTKPYTLIKNLDIYDMATNGYRCLSACNELLQDDPKHLRKCMNRIGSLQQIQSALSAPNDCIMTDDYSSTQIVPISSENQSDRLETSDTRQRLFSFFIENADEICSPDVFHEKISTLSSNDICVGLSHCIDEFTFESLNICIEVLQLTTERDKCIHLMSPLFSKYEEIKSTEQRHVFCQLLIMSIQSCTTVLDLKQMSWWLSVYDLTMSVEQQTILRLLWLYELYLNGLMLKMQKFAWLGCTAEAEYQQCIQHLYSKKIQYSIDHFPDNRSLASTTVVEVRYSDVYDPCFLIPYFYHYLSNDNYMFDAGFLTRRKIIAYCCRAFSSHCRLMRTVAYLSLCSLLDNLSTQLNFNTNQLRSFLMRIRSSNRSINRLDPIQSTFLARCSEHICNPNSPLFVAISKYLLKRPFLTLNTFPMYSQWFLNASVQACDYRQFIIETLKSGSSSTGSYKFIREHNALQGIISFLFAPSWMIKNQDRTSLFDIFSFASRDTSTCRLLIIEQAFPVILFFLSQVLPVVGWKQVIRYDDENLLSSLNYLQTSIKTIAFTMEDFSMFYR
ncbi:hypothetical protein GJ496_010642 [Pomphorhynchus laevis]|nr:hypothetical protein GJ496_010642 [Pomphorhynchus laevis]